jgi:gamma-glutamyltranspeptidase/glutathione hydrolase
VVARDGMVVAGRLQAADAGARMLLEGGNAVDAAVAAGWAVSVVEPWMNGIGGAGAMVVHHEGHQVAIDFGIRAPRAARPDMFELEPEGGGAFGWRAVQGRANELGHRAVGIPGVVAGLCLAHERFGRLPREVVMEPAIELAAAGFEADWHTTLMVAINVEPLARFPVTARTYLGQANSPPKPESRFASADRIVYGDLAGTLRRIAQEGARAFYGGEIAGAIADDMAANGGLVTRKDLEDYRPFVTEGGLQGTYRGHLVTGVPGTGSTVVQGILDSLGRHDLAAMGAGSVEMLHVLAEACRRSFATYFERASPAAAHTTHLCAVDRDRNAASITQTLGLLFGSFVTVPRTGILLNNLMSVFDPEPGHTHSIFAGASPAAAYAPTVLSSSGVVRAALGAPGGRRIPTAVAQVISNLVDLDMSIQDAISAPRIHAESPLVEVDSRFPDNVIAGLSGLGHQVVAEEKTPVSFNFAHPVGIVVRPDGLLAGGTDPMAPSAAVGLG